MPSAPETPIGHFFSSSCLPSQSTRRITGPPRITSTNFHFFNFFAFITLFHFLSFHFAFITTVMDCNGGFVRARVAMQEMSLCRMDYLTVKVAIPRLNMRMVSIA